MEEKELDQRLNEMFKEMVEVLETAKQGFLVENQTTLTEAERRLTRMLTSNLPFTESVVRKETKDPVEKKYLNLLPHLQLMAGMIRNLINEEKRKIESTLLFTDKAMTEIKEISTLMQTQFQDATDYLLTKNPRLKMHVRTGMEHLLEKAEDYVTAHEKRLIEGVCVPKSSYAYVAIVDLIKRVSMELSNFSEKL